MGGEYSTIKDTYGKEVELQILMTRYILGPQHVLVAS